jgi:hypothetical protein
MDEADRSNSGVVGGRPSARVHVAGVLRDNAQRCVRCGLKLSMDGPGFEVGSYVAHNATGYWVTGPKLEGNEVSCDSFERN